MRRAGNAARHFISEADEGLYEAMNKGTGLARGEYVLYLNAVDEPHGRFDPGHLQALASAAGHPAMIWARCVEVQANLAEVELKTRTANWAWYGMPVYHPAVFFKREVLGTEPYDLNYTIASDYNLLCRLLQDGNAPLIIDMFASRFHRGGLSENQHALTLLEEHRVRCHYFPEKRWLSGILMRFKKVLQRLSRYTAIRRLWRKRI